MLCQTLATAILLWAPTAPITHRAPVQLGIRHETALLGPVRAQAGIMLEAGNALPPLVRVRSDGDAAAHWGIGLAVGNPRIRLLGSWTRTDRLVAGTDPGYYVGFSAGAESRLSPRIGGRIERLMWTPKVWLAEPKRTIARMQWDILRLVATESASGRWGAYAQAMVHRPVMIRAGRELITSRGRHELRPAWIVGIGIGWESR
jgi:hypothetical protein